MALVSDIDNRFTYHPPSIENDQPARYEQIREAGRKLAHLLDELVPESWEKRVAIDQVDQAVMWANAGIARNE